MGDIKTRNWHKDKIILEHPEVYTEQLKPVELHMREDGAKDDTPSFCIVMANRFETRHFFGQVTLTMLNEALSELGYEIVKKIPVIEVMETDRYRDGGTIRYIDKNGEVYYVWWPTKKVYRNHPGIDATEPECNVILKEVHKF